MPELSAKNIEDIKCTKDFLCRANIEIKNSAIHRYGVFADELILPGEVIEECPVIVFEDYPAAIHNYIFNWDGQKTVLALGSGSIYNHSDTPNAKYTKDIVRQTLTFVATKPIYRGEEILVNYGEDWFRSRIIDFPSALGKKRKSAIKHIIFLGLFLLIAYSVTPIIAKHHVHSVPVAASVPQK